MTSVCRLSNFIEPLRYSAVISLNDLPVPKQHANMKSNVELICDYDILFYTCVFMFYMIMFIDRRPWEKTSAWS